MRAGGTLLTPVGQVSITSVETVDPGSISAAEARRAGYESKTELLEELQARSDGAVYRIALGVLQPDPRVALRETAAVTDTEIDALRSRLRRLDERAADGAWTTRTLVAIRDHPGVRAGDVCLSLDQAKEPFKVNVRKLKNLGLTESLDVGYRLSPRGEALLRVLLHP